MPSWLLALVGMGVWTAGLAGLVARRARTARLLCGLLLLNGSLLLILAAEPGRMDGQLMAWLALGSAPIYYLLAAHAQEGDENRE
ncbi:MAG: hypothetical protein H5T69_04920 [Chloroflexi bacterium]|nr:hypothetical protein [Chloroflexota bacterium]